MGSIKYSLWSFHLFTTISSKNHFHLIRIDEVGLRLWCKPQATCAGRESLLQGKQRQGTRDKGQGTRDKGQGGGEINDETALTSCGNCPSRRRRATPQSLLDTDQNRLASSRPPCLDGACASCAACYSRAFTPSIRPRQTALSPCYRPLDAPSCLRCAAPARLTAAPWPFGLTCCSWAPPRPAVPGDAGSWQSLEMHAAAGGTPASESAASE
jgi:hypothetical protein